MRNNIKRFFFTVISGVLGSGLWSVLNDNFIATPPEVTTIISVFIFCLLGGITYFFFPVLSSYYRMYNIGKFRGLWKNEELEKLIKEKYSKSNEIKIKVTRGYGLFYEESGVFKKCFQDLGTNPKTKTVKILLHYPCLESSHLERRAIANQKNKVDYVEDLFKVLKKLKEHNALSNTQEKIFVKFYKTDEDREWRYYIFNNENREKSLLFNHYSDNSTGSKSMMLKVNSGNDSLCEGMEKEFDGIFENASVELISNERTNTNLLNEDFCGHPPCQLKIKEIHEKYFK